MTFKYTTEGCFTKLLKEPPLPREDERVVKQMEGLKRHLTRRWLHNGCAVEEIGRFGYAKVNDNPVNESALAYHLEDLLAKPQPIANNDGYNPDGNINGTLVFGARFVIAALVDSQIKSGMERVLMDYCGFKLLDQYHGNSEKYGDTSRIGVYGVCCTRYVVNEEATG